MAAPKAKTLIERLGFNDPELTTPAHDEMFIVCMGSVQRIIDLVIASDERFDDYKIMRSQVDDNSLRYAGHNFTPPISECAASEYAAKYKRYGECDLTCEDVWNAPESGCIQSDCPILKETVSKMADIVKSMVYVPITTIPEKPIVTRNDFIIGFIDMFIEMGFKFPEGQRQQEKMLKSTWTSSDEPLSIAATVNILIEIKPSIRSVGELIRQIQTYREFREGNTVYVVISKTTAFKDILAQSDIILLNYADVLPESTRQETL